MIFLCYPKCSTCQKAKAWLDARGVSYTLRDIKLERPTLDELRTWPVSYTHLDVYKRQACYNNRVPKI